jgi:hypothetical protein
MRSEIKRQTYSAIKDFFQSKGEKSYNLQARARVRKVDLHKALPYLYPIYNIQQLYRTQKL